MTETTKKGLNPLKYLQEARTELSKVSWPSRKDTVRYSAIVVAVTVGLAAFFAVLDWGLTVGLEQLIKLNS